jgi:hypothetical protein
VQTGDEFMVREISKGEKPDDVKDTSVDKKLGYTVYYVTEDETFYHRSLHEKKFLGGGFADTPEFKALIAKYESEGWAKEIPWLEAQQEENRKIEKDRYTRQRIKAGYVIPVWSADIPVKDYQGGFSDAVFNQKYLQDYLQGGCHGYIGHSIRKKNLDAYIETRFIATARPICILEHLEPEKLLACWLTSTDGRHFGDSLEGMSYIRQMVVVRANVVDIYNHAYIYSLPEHKGDLKSTQELMREHAGKLLPE